MEEFPVSALLASGPFSDKNFIFATLLQHTASTAVRERAALSTALCIISTIISFNEAVKCFTEDAWTWKLLIS